MEVNCDAVVTVPSTISAAAVNWMSTMNKRNQVGNTATTNVGVRVPARRLPVLTRRRTRQPQHDPGTNSTSHCRHTRVASQDLYRTARSQSCVRHHSSFSHGSQSPTACPSNKHEFVHAQSADGSHGSRPHVAIVVINQRCHDVLDNAQVKVVAYATVGRGC